MKTIRYIYLKNTYDGDKKKSADSRCGNAFSEIKFSFSLVVEFLSWNDW